MANQRRINDPMIGGQGRMAKGGCQVPDGFVNLIVVPSVIRQTGAGLFHLQNVPTLRKEERTSE
jgi:hypothetical protein